MGGLSRRFPGLRLSLCLGICLMEHGVSVHKVGDRRGSRAFLAGLLADGPPGPGGARVCLAEARPLQRGRRLLGRACPGRGRQRAVGRLSVRPRCGRARHRGGERALHGRGERGVLPVVVGRALAAQHGGAGDGSPRVVCHQLGLLGLPPLHGAHARARRRRTARDDVLPDAGPRPPSLGGRVAGAGLAGGAGAGARRHEEIGRRSDRPYPAFRDLLVGVAQRGAHAGRGGGHGRGRFACGPRVPRGDRVFRPHHPLRRARGFPGSRGRHSRAVRALPGLAERGGAGSPRSWRRRSTPR